MAKPLARLAASSVRAKGELGQPRAKRRLAGGRTGRRARAAGSRRERCLRMSTRYCCS